MSANRLQRDARTVSTLTLLSRVTGLARDAVLSRVFGIGPVMDAFAFAFMLPNLFRRLFGEGALSAAFLPIYARLDRDDPKAARRFAAAVVAGLVVALAGLALLGEGVLWVLSARLGHDHLTLRLMMITLPYMPLVCLVAILGAMLQVHGRFAPTAAAPILLNGAIVVAALGSGWIVADGLLPAGDSGDPARLAGRAAIVAASIVVAGALQVAWSLLALRNQSAHASGPSWWQAWSELWRRGGALDAPRSAFREMLAKAGPMILGLGVLQVNTFVDGLIASWPSSVGPTIFGVDYPLASGALAALGYAQRLYEFPLGVFGIAVATAIFPLLARQANDPAAFVATVRHGLRLVIFIGLPASAGLLLVATPLTATILQGGDFTAEDTRRTAFILAGYAPAVWAYSMTHTLTRGFFALGDSRTPVRLSIWMVGLNFALNVVLIWTPLREAGLAWSTAICAILQASILLRLLGRKVTTDAISGAGAIVETEVRRSWARSALATALMCLAVWLVVDGIGGGRDGARSWGSEVLLLAIAVIAGIAVYSGAALGLRMPELRWAIGRAERRGSDSLSRSP
ncbi:MAG TPA: murein biosynthesis integral membrane protein MurJ [Phycisphaerales bacterium]|nr:murein biosynthesis integral membrane protein MurJ [Phycisphaerales bacterium]HMP37234.1 murein biosynthesis integral membrane protein MurJ [Phycisphaerales bacterium]